MAYDRAVSQVPRLQAFYNSWDDFWGDVQMIGGKLISSGQASQRTGTAVQNAANNAQNATSARVDVNTVLVLGVGALVLVELLSARRR